MFAVDQKRALRFALIIANHAREGMEKRGFARAGLTKNQYSFARFNAQV
jgi:hypothetical protein